MSELELTNNDLFQQVLEVYLARKEGKKKCITTTSCTHPKIIFVDNSHICTTCGQIISTEIFSDKEYTAIDMWSRTLTRKNVDKTIYNDVQDLGFEDDVVELANDIYVNAINGKITRGTMRKAMIFISIFHAYKLLHRSVSFEKLKESFSLDRRMLLKGLKLINLNTPKDSNVRVMYITPLSVVDEIIDCITPNGSYTCFIDKNKYKEDVIHIYNLTKDRSSLLNRSRPKSVAAALVYFVLKRDTSAKSGGCDIISSYIKNVGLSEITVSKLSKEIDRILQGLTK